jgi:hypothetical protein
MRILKLIRKYAAITAALGVFLSISYAGYHQYRRHVPVEPEGTCLVFKLMDFDEVAAGRLSMNDVVEGTATISVPIFDSEFPMEVTFEHLRNVGYILVSCEKL